LRQKHYDNWKKALQDRKDAEEKAKTAEREREAERERISRTANERVAKQLAEYQARYIIPDIPEIF
jgi:hypothetical protein